MTITAERTAPPTTAGNRQADVLVIEQKNLMEARLVSTGALLGVAERSRGNRYDEWTGWAIQVPGRKAQVVIPRTQAKDILEAVAASMVRPFGYQLVLRDRHDITVRVELTGTDEFWTYPQVRDLLLGLERLLPARLNQPTRYFAVEPVRA